MSEDAGREGADRPTHRALVERLDAFRERLASEFRASLDDLVDDGELEGRIEDGAAGVRTAEGGEGEEFAARYARWIQRQSWGADYADDPDRVHRRFVEQAAYLYASRLLFLAVPAADDADVPAVDSEDFADPERRRALFDDLADRTAVGPIYERDPAFDALPLSSPALAAIGALLDDLERYDRRRLDRDVLGRLYERIIPTGERRDLGQYYTPPAVAELICALAIRDPDDVVLDPACGSGAFLLAAYDRLDALQAGERASDGAPNEDEPPRTDAPAGAPRHGELLEQLHGIDVNRFPAHLAAINLALRAPSGADGVNVAVADFFDVEPGGTADGRAVGASSHPATGEPAVPGEVDAVVANPPYIRQEAIADKERLRRHLDREAVDADLGERSDAYGYFLTHASEFLAADGRLGMITPDKWLSVAYGEGLRAFFLDNFRVEAVVSFPRRVFAEPLVPTCVTVLERCDDPDRRAANVVPFVRLEERVPVEAIREAIERDRDADELVDAPRFRLLAKRQADLRAADNWRRFLHAPPVYWELRRHPAVRPLGELADVTYGTKPGAVDYFFPEEETLGRFDLADSEWFRPAIKSIRDADRPRFEAADADRLVLDVHGLVTDVLASGATPAAADREAVRAAEAAYASAADDEPRALAEAEVVATALIGERGHRDLFDYLLHGVRRGYHDRRTCAARRIWFDLGELPEAPIVTSQFVWEDAPYLHLPTPLPVSNALSYVDPVDGVDPELLAAALNADVTRLFMELHGRVEGGRALQIQVYEREALPVVDVREFDADDRAAVRDAFEDLVAARGDEREGEAGERGGGGAGERDARAARRRLNERVLAAIGAGDAAPDVAAYADALSEARRAGKATGRLLANPGRDDAA